jgi:ureidoglycolate hydrolase
MAMHDVKLERLRDISMKEFSQFGRIIGRDEDSEEGSYNLHPIDAKAAVDNDMIKAYWDLIPFEPSDQERFSMGMLFLKSKPPGEPIDWSECHRQTHEFFFPLGGKQLIFVLCPPMDIPDPKKTRAFIVGPDEGVMLDKGTWHYPPFAVNGITPCLMPRYGKLGIRHGKVTKAYGKEWNTDGPGFIEGELHALDTPFYGGDYSKDEYNIRIIF